eukprot:jgi/Bigna1/78576/fgenesh1_pg.55_\
MHASNESLAFVQTSALRPSEVNLASESWYIRDFEGMARIPSFKVSRANEGVDRIDDIVISGCFGAHAGINGVYRYSPPPPSHRGYAVNHRYVPLLNLRQEASEGEGALGKDRCHYLLFDSERSRWSVVVATSAAGEEGGGGGGEEEEEVAFMDGDSQQWHVVETVVDDSGSSAFTPRRRVTTRLDNSIQLIPGGRVWRTGVLEIHGYLGFGSEYINDVYVPFEYDPATEKEQQYLERRAGKFCGFRGVLGRSYLYFDRERGGLSAEEAFYADPHSVVSVPSAGEGEGEGEGGGGAKNAFVRPYDWREAVWKCRDFRGRVVNMEPKPVLSSANATLVWDDERSRWFRSVHTFETRLGARRRALFELARSPSWITQILRHQQQQHHQDVKRNADDVAAEEEEEEPEEGSSSLGIFMQSESRCMQSAFLALLRDEPRSLRTPLQLTFPSNEQRRVIAHRESHGDKSTSSSSSSRQYVLVAKRFLSWRYPEIMIDTANAHHLFIRDLDDLWSRRSQLLAMHDLLLPSAHSASSKQSPPLWKQQQQQQQGQQPSSSYHIPKLHPLSKSFPNLNTMGYPVVLEELPVEERIGGGQNADSRSSPFRFIPGGGGEVTQLTLSRVLSGFSELLEEFISVEDLEAAQALTKKDVESVYRAVTVGLRSMAATILDLRTRHFRLNARWLRNRASHRRRHHDAADHGTQPALPNTGGHVLVPLGAYGALDCFEYIGEDDDDIYYNKEKTLRSLRFPYTLVAWATSVLVSPKARMLAEHFSIVSSTIDQFEGLSLYLTGSSRNVLRGVGQAGEGGQIDPGNFDASGGPRSQITCKKLLELLPSPPDDTHTEFGKQTQGKSATMLHSPAVHQQRKGAYPRLTQKTKIDKMALLAAISKPLPS